jgi:hypothetical protein
LGGMLTLNGLDAEPVKAEEVGIGA